MLWQLARPGRGRTHAERIEDFYARQSQQYDAFRNRLLPGRSELFRALADVAMKDRRVPLHWTDFGGGTGANVEYIADRLDRIATLDIVDLSPSLLAVARRRIVERGWANVRTTLGDATEHRPTDARPDVVTFSYSLSMIPDWFAAIERAFEMLRPGGLIGVVDFFVSRRHPDPGSSRHGWWTRTFWPAWFAVDGVLLSPDPPAMLCRKFRIVRHDQRRTRVPYVPLGRVPYYLFIGVKPG